MRHILRSHVGKRPNNEDAGRIVALDADHLLVVVADGMGGHAAGEVASTLAVETLVEAVVRAWPIADWAPLLKEAVLTANRKVYETSRAEKAVSGMGTTLDAVIVGIDRGIIAHVGDGRSYLMQSGRLTRLTEDHSYIGELLRQGAISEAEAEVHPRRHVILRAVGTEALVEVDLVAFEWSHGDRLLVCTDGFSNVVPTETIAALLSRTELDVVTVGERLLEEALVRGGEDNITLAVVEAPADAAVETPTAEGGDDR